MLIPEGHEFEDICVKFTKDYQSKSGKLDTQVNRHSLSAGTCIVRYTAMSSDILSLSVLKKEARWNSFETCSHHHEASFAFDNSSTAVCFLC